MTFRVLNQADVENFEKLGREHDLIEEEIRRLLESFDLETWGDEQSNAIHALTGKQITLHAARMALLKAPG